MGFLFDVQSRPAIGQPRHCRPAIELMTNDRRRKGMDRCRSPMCVDQVRVPAYRTTPIDRRQSSVGASDIQTRYIVIWWGVRVAALPPAFVRPGPSSARPCVVRFGHYNCPLDPERCIAIALQWIEQRRASLPPSPTGVPVLADDADRDLFYLCIVIDQYSGVCRSGRTSAISIKTAVVVAVTMNGKTAAASASGCR
jgi:hypothetical protein